MAAAVKDEKPTLNKVIIAGVGYTGLPMVWILWRRLTKGGGLQRMLDATVKGSVAAKIGGVGLICTGAGGCLTSVGCILASVVSGHFLTEIGSCWQGILIGGGLVSAGFVALDLGSKAAAGIEAAKAAAIIQVALSKTPPTPTPEVGVDTQTIEQAMAVITAPPIVATPVPK